MGDDYSGRKVLGTRTAYALFLHASSTGKADPLEGGLTTFPYYAPESQQHMRRDSTCLDALAKQEYVIVFFSYGSALPQKVEYPQTARIAE